MPTTITPHAGHLLADLNPVSLFTTLWSRRELISQLIRREIAARYRGSLLGLLWAVMNPLVLLVVYTFVFGVVFRARWPHPDTGSVTAYGLALFCGLIAFNVLAECLGRAPGLVVGVPNYVKKVVFPLEVLPVTLVGVALFHGVISLGVLVVFAGLTGHPPRPTLLLVPLVALPLVFMSVGLTYVVASLGVFFRDIGHIVQLGLQALLFASAVFYPIDAVPDWLRPAMRVNPLTAVAEDFRRVIAWGTVPDWGELTAWLVLSGTVMILGYGWFRRTKKAFADVM
jgi:lipopolysaccharide transport system permease protein